MLVLTRKPGQTITIGDDIRITVMDIKGGQVRLGIEAPRHVTVYREEIYLKVKEENILAARAAVRDVERVQEIWLKRSGKKETDED